MEGEGPPQGGERSDQEKRDNPQTIEELREALILSTEETRTLQAQVRTVGLTLDRIDAGRQAEVTPIAEERDRLQAQLTDERRSHVKTLRLVRELATDHQRIIDDLQDARNRNVEEDDILGVIEGGRDIEATNAAMHYRNRHITELEAIIESGFARKIDDGGNENPAEFDEQHQQTARLVAEVTRLSDEGLAYRGQIRTLERRLAGHEQDEAELATELRRVRGHLDIRNEELDEYMELVNEYQEQQDGQASAQLRYDPRPFLQARVLRERNELMNERDDLRDERDAIDARTTNVLIPLRDERNNLLNENDGLRNQLREIRMTPVLLRNLDQRIAELVDGDPEQLEEQRMELVARLDRPQSRNNSVVHSGSPPPLGNHIKADFRAWLIGVNQRTQVALNLNDEELGDEVARADTGFEDFVIAGSHPSGSQRSFRTAADLGQTDASTADQLENNKDGNRGEQAANQGQEEGGGAETQDPAPQFNYQGQEQAVLPEGELIPQLVAQRQGQTAVVPARSPVAPVVYSGGRGLIAGLLGLFRWDRGNNPGERSRDEDNTPVGDDPDFDRLFDPIQLVDYPGEDTVMQDDAAPGVDRPSDPTQEPPGATPAPPTGDGDCPEQLRRAQGERDTAIQERDNYLRARDDARQGFDDMTNARDAAREELNNMTTARDNLIIERDHVHANLIQARRDLAERTAERNGARTRVQLLETEADGSSPEDLQATFVAMAESLRGHQLDPVFAHTTREDLQRLVELVEVAVRRRELDAENRRERENEIERLRDVALGATRDLQMVIGLNPLPAFRPQEIIDNLRNTTRHAVTRINNIEHELRDRERQMNILQQHNGSLDERRTTRISELEQQIHINSGAAGVITAEVERVRILIALMNRDAATLTEERDRLRTERDEAQTARDIAINEREAAIGRGIEVATQIANMRDNALDERDEARNERNIALRDRNIAGREMYALQTEQDNIQESLGLARRLLRESTEALGRSIEERRQLQEDLDARNETITGIRGEINGLQDARGNLRRAVLRRGGTLLEDGERVDGEDGEEPDDAPGIRPRRDSDDGAEGASLGSGSRDRILGGEIDGELGRGGRDSPPPGSEGSGEGDDWGNTVDVRSVEIGGTRRHSPPPIPEGAQGDGGDEIDDGKRRRFRGVEDGMGHLAGPAPGQGGEPVDPAILPPPPPPVIPPFFAVGPVVVAPIAPPAGPILPAPPVPVVPAAAAPQRRSVRTTGRPKPDYGGSKTRGPRKRKDAPEDGDDGTPKKRAAKEPAKKPGPKKGVARRVDMF